MEAVILAGGRGTRLGSLTDDLPKPMLPVLGKPFLEHLLNYWAGQGIRRFIVSAGYRHESIQAHFGKNWQGIEIVMSIEEQPLGTGGGLLHAERLLASDGSFLCLNGDTFFAVEMKELAAFHKRKKASATLSLFEPSSQARYEGVGLEEDGKISRWSKRGSGLKGYANGGVYMMDRRIFEKWEVRPELALSLENTMLPELLHLREPVYGRVSKGTFIDIGTPEDLSRAEHLLGVYNADA